MKREPINSVVLPETMRAHVELDPKDGATALQHSVTLRPENQVLFVGEWRGYPDAPPTLAAGYSLTVPDGVTALDADLKPASEAPLPGTKTHLYKFLVPLTGPMVTQAISVVTNKGAVVPLHVTAKLRSEVPWVILDPACGSFGISAEIEPAATQAPKEAAREPLIALVRCTREGSAISIKAWTWNQLRWNAPAVGTPGRWQLDPAHHSRLSGLLPLFPENGSGLRMALPLSWVSGRPHAGANVYLNQTDLRVPSWQISATIGPTWSTYKETPVGFPEMHVSQVGLTGKAQMQFRIRPPRWDMALSVFGTIAPLSVVNLDASSANPATLPGARWLGVNLRAGYTLPLDFASRNVLSILPGIYAWSMFVPDHQYGAHNLNGPQLVLAYTRELGWRPSKGFTLQRVGVYGKFAAITPGFALPDLGDHELAGGGSVTFKLSFVPRPLVLAGDYSTLVFDNDAFALGLQTFSLSLGISVF